MDFRFDRLGVRVPALVAYTPGTIINEPMHHGSLISSLTSRFELKHDDDRPLSPPGVGLLALLLARYAPNDPVPRTYREAYEAIHRHGEGLFGTTNAPTPDGMTGEGQ